MVTDMICEQPHIFQGKYKLLMGVSAEGNICQRKGTEGEETLQDYKRLPSVHLIGSIGVKLFLQKDK